MFNQSRLKIFLFSIIFVFAAANAYVFYMQWSIDNGTAIFLRSASRVPPHSGIAPQPLFPPNPPTDFLVPWQNGAYTERVELDWKKSIAARNNAPDGYLVYRTPASINAPCAAGTLYAAVGNVSGFTDRSVHYAAPMNYSVQAYNGAGMSACTSIKTGAPAQCPNFPLLNHTANPDGTCSFGAGIHVAGHIRGPSSPNWSTARDAPSGTASGNHDQPQVQVSRVTNYVVQRSFFTFLTNSMPDESVIHSAVFSANIWNAASSIADDNKLIYLLETQPNDSMILEGGDYPRCGSSVGELASAPVSLLDLEPLPWEAPFTFSIFPAHYSYISRVYPGTEYCFREEHDYFNTPFPTLTGGNFMSILNVATYGTPRLLITYTPAGLSIPHYPRGVTASANQPGQITLTWEPVENADGYYIYRTPGSCDSSQTIIGQNTTSFTDTNVVSGTIYYYQIKSYYEGNKRFSGQSTCGGGGHGSPLVSVQAI